ncbi:MAG: hypothetical protein ACE5HD_11425 [Acidobacteriota bacterium]
MMAVLTWSGLAMPAETVFQMPLEWHEGLLETRHYNIVMESSGTVIGQFEMKLYGKTGHGGQPLFRLSLERVVTIGAPGGKPVQAASDTEVIFAAKTLDLIEKREHYASGEAEGRMKAVRTPDGVKRTIEAAAEEIDFEPEETDVKYDLHPLIEQTVLPYVVRAQPEEEGREFELKAIDPRKAKSIELHGRIGPLQTISWGGQEVEVRRVDLTTPKGTTSYFIRHGGERELLRYTGLRGERYELQRPAKPGS